MNNVNNRQRLGEYEQEEDALQRQLQRRPPVRRLQVNNRRRLEDEEMQEEDEMQRRIEWRLVQRLAYLEEEDALQPLEGQQDKTQFANEEHERWLQQQNSHPWGIDVRYAQQAIAEFDLDGFEKFWPRTTYFNRKNLLRIAIAQTPQNAEQLHILFEFVRFMVRHMKFEINDPYPKGELVTAAQNSRYDIFLYLVHHARSIDNQKDTYLLFDAIEGGQILILKYLVQHGMDPHVHGDEAVLAAAKHNRFDMLQFLVEKCKLDIQNRDDAVLFTQYLEHDGVEILEYAHSKGCNIHRHNDVLVAIAAKEGAIRCLRYLVEHDANFHQRNEQTFQHAVLVESDKSPAMMQYLIEKGVDMTVAPARRAIIKCIHDHDVKRLAAILAGGGLSVESLTALINAKPDKKHVYLYIFDWMQYFIIQNLVSDVLLEAQIGGISSSSKTGIILPEGIQQTFVDIGFYRARKLPEFDLLRVLVEIRPLTKDTQGLLRRGLLGQLIMTFKKMPIEVYEKRFKAQQETAARSLLHFRNVDGEEQSL